MTSQFVLAAKRRKKIARRETSG